MSFSHQATNAKNAPTNIPKKAWVRNPMLTKTANRIQKLRVLDFLFILSIACVVKHLSTLYKPQYKPN